MPSFIKPALFGNASSLGYHWMYKQDFLENLVKEKNLLFQVPNKEEYEAAGRSYYAYPNAKLGDVTVQGQILKWLYQAVLDNPDFNSVDYKNLLFNQFRPGGTYQGYVESYAKKLVINQLNDELKLGLHEIENDDDHLVGFVPYWVSKELDKSIAWAFELTNVFSSRLEYKMLFQMFDQLMILLNDHPLREAILKSLPWAPKGLVLKIEKGLEMSDTKSFIKQYSGTACSIYQSIPLIFHLLWHSTSLDELLEKNIILGGATSDRAMVLLALWNQYQEVPKEFYKKMI
ncbi:MAG: hypothetical protein C4537_00910 [Acholeplasma sp.]|jgi:hypothetical protein|nr:MAG: hypothetical protein C4537_00910 [Acholeplasma sp.]